MLLVALIVLVSVCAAVLVAVLAVLLVLLLRVLVVLVALGVPGNAFARADDGGSLRRRGVLPQCDQPSGEDLLAAR